MASHGFNDGKEAQRVHWTSEGHGFTAIHVNLEPNIESQHEHALAFVGGTRITCPGRPFAHGGYRRSQIIDGMKGIVRTTIDEGRTTSLRSASTHVGRHHTTKWNFFNEN